MYYYTYNQLASSFSWGVANLRTRCNRERIFRYDGRLLGYTELVCLLSTIYRHDLRNALCAMLASTKHDFTFRIGRKYIHCITH